MHTKLEKSVDLMAEHFVDVINGQPNAWGQHCSPIYGQSHYILIRMTRLFGDETTQRAINKALKEGN